MKHSITPYLSFNGNAKEALNYYQEVFDGEVWLQTFGEADFPTPPEADDRVMHGQFKKDALFFMVSDCFVGSSVEIGSNISLVLECSSEDEIQSLYEKLKQQSTVQMELSDTFWGAMYAKVKDPFGVTWDLNYKKA